MSKIYTKKGDKGKTSFFNGTVCNKNDPRCSAYGTVDELNSMIGVVIAEVVNYESRIRNYGQELKSSLIAIQHDLFRIGASLANPSRKSEIRNEKLEKRTEEFEKMIDEMTDKLPPLKNFILPGGSKAGSLLQLARSVCRRAEREVVALAEKEGVDPAILVYINRLSDLLFTMARFINFKDGQKETIWKQ